MRALLVGLGGVQADLLRLLKERGWWVAGCSYRAEGPGLEEYDHFAVVDVLDPDGVTALARRSEVQAVYAAGMELPMETVAVARRRLGQEEWFPPEAARLARSKPALRRFLNDRDLSPVAFARVESPAGLARWHRYPAVVKPADAAGQRGVFVAGSAEEAAAGLERTLSFSPRGEAIVEEWLDGPEVSANVFVREGRVVACLLSDRLTLEGYPGGLPRAHVMPSQAADGAAAVAVEALLGRVVAALGIRQGPVYAQLKLTGGGPRLIEVSPRLDGCHLWRLAREAFGIDLLRATADLLGGGEPGLEAAGPGRPLTLRMLHRPPGEVFREADDAIPGDALGHGCHYRDGEVVRPGNGLMETVGWCLMPRA
ncbi:MAG: ATP-grasp protein [Acidobacteria bacterium]|nr:ATP-grasp protein [Acidobacteriota bacterium]